MYDLYGLYVVQWLLRILEWAKIFFKETLWLYKDPVPTHNKLAYKWDSWLDLFSIELSGQPQLSIQNFFDRALHFPCSLSYLISMWFELTAIHLVTEHYTSSLNACFDYWQWAIPTTTCEILAVKEIKYRSRLASSVPKGSWLHTQLGRVDHSQRSEMYTPVNPSGSKLWMWSVIFLQIRSHEDM